MYNVLALEQANTANTLWRKRCPQSVAPQNQSTGRQFECSMTGRTRGKFANNEQWPELH